MESLDGTGLERSVLSLLLGIVCSRPYTANGKDFVIVVLFEV